MVSLPMINMTDWDITIRAGTSLGTITQSKEESTVAEETSSVTALADKGPRPTNRSKKKEEYVRNFVWKAKERQGNEKKIDTTKFTQEEKWKWILEMFRLAQKPCLAKGEDLEKATDLLLKYWDLFSHDGPYGQPT